LNGPVTAIVWAPSTNSAHGGEQSIVAGFADGKFCLWTQLTIDARFKTSWTFEAFKAQIEALALSDTSSRLAVVGGKFVKVYNLRGFEAVEPHAEEVSVSTARTASFVEGGTVLMVGYLESHELVLWDVQPWKRRFCSQLQTRIGHLSWSSEERALAVANLLDGVDIYYGLEPAVWSKTMLRNIYKNTIKHVAFSHQGRFVVSGGDKGKALIWRLSDGLPVQVLNHRSGRPVQAVASFYFEQEHLIATSESGPQPRIYVWCSSIRPARLVELAYLVDNLQSADVDAAHVVVFVLLVLASVVFYISRDSSRVETILTTIDEGRRRFADWLLKSMNGYVYL